MRILMLNYEFPPLGGGGGWAASNLASELVVRGHEIDYVTTGYRSLSRRETIDGVRLFREPVFARTNLETATTLSMLCYPVVAARRSLALARARAYDIVHSHFAIPSAPAGVFVARRLGLPHVLSVYGGDIYDPSKKNSPHRRGVLRWTVRWVLRNADLVVPESRDLEQRVRDIYDVDIPLRRIPLAFPVPGLHPVSRESLGLKPDALYAIVVSRLIPRKAHGDLLRAFAAAGAPEAELLIVGDGPEEPAIRALARDLGIADRVRLLGAVSEERKHQLLHVSDFFVLATRHEGFGLVYLEAMCRGLPIATTNVGGQTDFLAEGENALLTPPDRPRELAASIERLARDAELRRAMGERNRRAVEPFLPPAVAARYEEAFHEAADRFRARRAKGRT